MNFNNIVSVGCSYPWKEEARGDVKHYPTDEKGSGSQINVQTLSCQINCGEKYFCCQLFG
jgi:hypothetical protein